MSIQIVCAWCDRDMGEKKGDSTCHVSHSICPDCERKVRAGIENALNQNNPKTNQNERRI